MPAPRVMGSRTEAAGLAKTLWGIVMAGIKVVILTTLTMSRRPVSPVSDFWVGREVVDEDWGRNPRTSGAFI